MATYDAEKIPDAAPKNPVRQRVDGIIDDLTARRVTPVDRARLGKALDTAEKPQTGRPGADAGLGRAIHGRG